MRFIISRFLKLPLLVKILLILILLLVIFLTASLIIKQINRPQTTKNTSIIPTVTLNNRQTVRVIKVIDGDTIQIEGGRFVRYIGIDSPELADSGKPATCFSEEATIRNRELVEGKFIELEKDVSENDQYGRLLRYVYQDGVLINELLVSEGEAVIDPFPPNIKYQEKFKEEELKAKAENRGIWKECTCSAKTSCRQMLDCQEAQFYFQTCQIGELDDDRDGLPCESLCGP